MDLYDKIQTVVLTCAVCALGASVYVNTIGTDLKHYSMPLAITGCLLGVSNVWIGYIVTRLREKKLYQNIGSVISKYTDQIDKPRPKAK